MSQGVNFAESHKMVNCFSSGFIAANEDIFNGSPASDVINMRDWRDIIFWIQEGAGGTGTTVPTIESCDDTTPSNTTAIIFRYRIIAAVGDTWTAWTDAATTGFTTTAAADTMFQIWARASDLSGTDQYIRMQTTEGDSTAVDGGMGAILFNPRYAEDIMRTVLT